MGIFRMSLRMGDAQVTTDHATKSLQRWRVSVQGELKRERGNAAHSKRFARQDAPWKSRSVWSAAYPAAF